MAYVIARLIHAEPIPGTNQFWTTRPYRWQSLLAAKVLFSLVFLIGPLLIARLTVVVWGGFPLRSSVAGLAWSQLAFLLAAAIPVAALASLTEGLVPFVFLTLIALEIGLGSQQSIFFPSLGFTAGRIAGLRRRMDPNVCGCHRRCDNGAVDSLCSVHATPNLHQPEDCTGRRHSRDPGSMVPPGIVRAGTADSHLTEGLRSGFHHNLIQSRLVIRVRSTSGSRRKRICEPRGMLFRDRDSVSVSFRIKRTSSAVASARNQLIVLSVSAARI
jgi:hypothetical protein